MCCFAVFLKHGLRWNRKQSQVGWLTLASYFHLAYVALLIMFSLCIQKSLQRKWDLPVWICWCCPQLAACLPSWVTHLLFSSVSPLWIWNSLENVKHSSIVCKQKLFPMCIFMVILFLTSHRGKPASSHPQTSMASNHLLRSPCTSVWSWSKLIS